MNQIENKNPNINSNSQNDKEIETQAELEKIRLKNQDDDSTFIISKKYIKLLQQAKDNESSTKNKNDSFSQHG